VPLGTVNDPAPYKLTFTKGVEALPFSLIITLYSLGQEKPRGKFTLKVLKNQLV